MTDGLDALARARLSLEGLSVGDALGGFYEFGTAERMNLVLEMRRVPDIVWHYTDDTNMALSIYENLRKHGGIDQDSLARSFMLHYDRFRGYGRGVRSWVARCINGESWRDVTHTLFRGSEGSFGNGGAMRVAPVGAYFADDVEAAKEHAALSAELTHSHPDGIAGAVAIAVGAAIAWQTRHDALTRADFLAQIVPHVPSGRVRDGVQKALDMPLHHDVTGLAALVLGNGREIAAHDTVPLALWISGMYLHDYEEAIWQALGAGGDSDTLAAMIGGIVALSSGEATIPQTWRAHREALPPWAVSSP